MGTFQYIWDKSAIKDVGRVLGIPFEVTNQITKELDDRSLSEADDLKEKWGSKYPKLFPYAEKLAGLPRSFSMHPCGRVITLDDLDYYTAVQESNGEIVLHTDMKDAEELGLVKIDTLGLRTVDLIYDVLEMIGKDYDYIAPKNHTFDDSKVMEVFQNGHTDGVFQFESDGMKKILMRMKPTNLDDLGAANALYRPGSLKYIDEFINRKHGKVEVKYLHPDLEEILKPTYGIIVFQEQLIEIGRLAGLRNPDLIRKGTAKKMPELLAKLEPEVKEGLKQRGWTQEQVDKLWEDMLDFGRYSFNRSHSYAYAMIAYITAFLKTYHPIEFACALLNSFEGKKDKMETCYKEALRLGVKFAKPNWRNVSPLCTIRNGEIVYGLSLIKGCNRQMAEELSKFKDKKYDYFVQLLVDIVENTSINKDQLITLIKLNYFSEFGNNQSLLNIYETFKVGKNVKYSKTYKQATKQKRITALIELEKKEIEKNNASLSLSEQLFEELDAYGYMATIYPEINKSVALIYDIEVSYNKPKLYLRQLKTGKTVMMKMDARKYLDHTGNPVLEKGDIIKIDDYEMRPRWRKTENGFEKIPGEYEPYLVSCTKINLGRRG